MNKKELMKRIYNPSLTSEEINKLFEIILNWPEEKEIQINIELYQEEGPIKIKRCLYA